METFNIILRIFSNPLGLAIAIFFFGASIFVHELGHYLAARWRGLKIERFSIGMGKKLYGWIDQRGCEWQVAMLPIGGYVLLPQLADMKGIEGPSNLDQETLPELSWTDKVIVASAGAVFNIIFALLLASVLWTQPFYRYNDTTVVGVVQPTIENADGLVVPGPAWEAGIRPGDEITSIDGKPVNNFNDLRLAILLGNDASADGMPRSTIGFRNAEGTHEAVITPVLIDLERKRLVGIGSSQKLIVGDMLENSPAMNSGLHAGDEIFSVNGEALYTFRAFEDQVDAHPGQPLALQVQRNGELLPITLTPIEVPVFDDGTTSPEVGILWAPPPSEEYHMAPWTQVAEVVSLTFRTIRALVSPSSNVGLRAMGGPIEILYVVQQTSEQGWQSVLLMVILINVNLAIINMLPLPIIDGGHIVIATWKKLFGRPMPARVIATLQTAMMFLLLFSVIYISFFNVLRVGRTEREDIAFEQEQAKRIPIVFPAKGEEG